MNEDNIGLVYSVYIPSPAPAVILLVFWTFFYFTAPKSLLYNIPADIFICSVIYGVARLFSNGKKVRARVVENRLGKFLKENQKESLEQMKKEMNQYITTLKEDKENIESDRLNDELEKMIVIIKMMLQYAIDNPDQIKSLQKLFESYMSPFMELLTMYIKYEKDPMISKEMKEGLKEIEKSSHFVREELEEKIQVFYSEKITDVTADIAALETMLIQQ
ncbi:MAG: 5-bromo-4-chloroindolyl phosphate hydrolysis family protein [Beduini sp.]|uniref:5-bromo-4-chloroindolyl phosphate hydrolysis family protein n=1 Tax=Beduini sp. TaxID=1922300 RepID=UPI0011C87018